MYFKKLEKFLTILSPENLNRFFIFGILIYLLFGQGVDLYAEQTQKNFFPAYSREFEEAVLWLKNNSDPDAVILSEWTQGHQIVAIARRGVVATSKVYPSEARETAERYKDIADFFFADSEDRALEIAEKYGTSLVFVRKNFDWWTCRYVGKCDSAAGTLIERMINGDKFNAFSEVYRTDNFLVFRIEKKAEKKLFAGFPEDYFSRIINVSPETKIQWNGEITSILGAILPHHLFYTSNFLADFFQKLSQIQQIDTFILLGPDHFNLAKSFITVSKLSWQTPWGEIEPDENAADGLVKDGGAAVDNEVNEREHSLKNLIPFIGRRFPGAKAVSVIFKDGTGDEEIREFSAALKKFINPRTVILVSADFAHHLSLERTLQEDARSLAAIKNFNFAGIKEIEADARPAISLLLSVAEESGANRVNLLSHFNNLDSLKEGSVKTANKTVSYLVSYFFLSLSR